MRVAITLILLAALIYGCDKSTEPTPAIFEARILEASSFRAETLRGIPPNTSISSRVDVEFYSSENAVVSVPNVSLYLLPWDASGPWYVYPPAPGHLGDMPTIGMWNDLENTVWTDWDGALTAGKRDTIAIVASANGNHPFDNEHSMARMLLICDLDVQVEVSIINGTDTVSVRSDTLVHDCTYGGR